MLDGDHPEACSVLAQQWNSDAMDALLLLVPIAKASGYDGKGDFHRNDDGRIAFRSSQRAPYIFTGLQIISPTLINEGPEGAFSTRLLWDRAATRGRLYGALYEGFWMHVGDPEGLAAAERRITSHPSCP